MQGSKRATSLLVWCLVAQIATPARPVRAFSTDSSTLPTGRGLAPAAVTATSAAPATDLFTGAATREIAIEAPPGTGGMTPQLALRYSSQARGDSWVGSGWSLGFPAIARSLRDGVPRYDDEVDGFEFAGQELVPETNDPARPRRYHTLRESFVRIVHEANGSWTVTRKDGVAMRFGVSATGRIENGAGQTFQWLFEQQEDRHGNVFTASYDRRDPGTAYLATVRYTLRRGASGTFQSLDGDASRDRRIEFVLEAAARPDVAEGHRAGFLSRVAHRLDAINVKVGSTLVRRYDLRYAQSPDTFRSLLTSVALYGNDAASANPHAPFATSFAYSSNVVAGTTGWQRVDWSWPAGLSLVDANRQDRGVRIADVDGDSRPDLVKALATQGNPDPLHATFALSADSGVYLNTGAGFESAPSATHVFPSFAGQNGEIPFSLAWQDANGSRTTGLDLLDVTGDGRADLVGGVRSLDPASGASSLYGMPTWYRGSANGFVAADDVGDPFVDGLWGVNRSGIVDIYVFTATQGTTSGNARFADLTGDGLPELIVRGAEYRWTAIGGPFPFQAANPNCLDERISDYYFENRGALHFERAPIANGVGVYCQASLKRVATDFQHCDLDDRVGCAYRVLYNDARAMHFAGDPSLGTFPWYWYANWEFGALDVDLDGDGLADTLSATSDPGYLGLGVASTVWLNDGARGYVESPAWKLPAGVYLYELGAFHSIDTGVRLADVNGDGRVDVLRGKAGVARTTWLNDGDAEEALPTPWIASNAWSIPSGLEFVDANGLDTGVRLLDLDGDGMTDLVRSTNGADEVYRNRGSLPDLLTQVTNPLGARTQYAYDVSTRQDPFGSGAAGMPIVVPVVAAVTTSPSPGVVGDPVGTTRYVYQGGVYDAAAREFRGFATVAETSPDGRRTIRVHHQSEALAGKLASETVRDAEDRIWLEVEYAYGAASTPPYVGLIESVTRREYDGRATPRITRTEYRWDAYGNPTATVEWGEVDGAGADLVPGDTRTTELDYAANDALFLVDRVKARRVREGATPNAGAVVRESRFFYDGDTSGTAAPIAGDLTRRVDVLGDASRPDPTTTWGYDAYGNPTRVTDPLANAGGAGGTTITEWDATYHSFPTAVVNALGHRSEIDYATAPGCAVTHSGGTGLVGSERGPNDLSAGTSWRRCYDVFGRIVGESAPADLAVTSWTWDDTPLAAFSIEARRTSATGLRWTTTHYDGLGRTIGVDHTGPGGRVVFDRSIGYDAMGRIVSETQPNFDAPGPATRTDYDVLGRAVAITRPGAGRVSRRDQDRGLVIDTDATGHVVRRLRDALGRIVRVEEVAGPDTLVTRYEYDRNDQLTRIVDHHGNASTVSWDALGRRIAMTDPDIGSREFGYDANGNLLSERIAGLETISWRYDKLGRPLLKSGASTRNFAPSTIVWVYDTSPNGVGLPAARWDDDVHVQRVTSYDLLGRATRERDELTIANTIRLFDFENEYDALGQLASRRHPTGTRVRFTRDAYGYLTAIASDGAAPDATAIEWSADGRLASWTAPGGVVSAADYDATTQRLASLRVDAAAGRVLDETLHYDAADRVTTVVDLAGSNTIDLAYDPLGRLQRSFRLEDGVWVTRTNAYDAIGNLTCRDATGANCEGGTRFAYPFAAADPLERATSHRAIGVGGAASLYEAAGKVVSLGARSFRYDAFGQLVQAWNGSTLALEAKYDGDGRNYRLWSAASGESTFLPTPDFEWSETSQQARVHVMLGGARIATHAMAFTPPTPPPRSCAGADPVAPPAPPLDLVALFAPGIAALILIGVRRAVRFVPAERRGDALVATGTGTAFLLVALMPVPFAQPGAAGAQTGIPSSLYYHGDQLGSVLAVTDANGDLVGPPVAFEPWGRPVGAAALPTPFGFHGKRLAGGIYDYGARWYDPSVGRFLQPDPVIADPYDPQGLSRYAYARNDPVGRVDPTGAWSFSANLYGGTVDGSGGCTCLTLGVSLWNGGNYSVSAQATVGGVPIAQAVYVSEALEGLNEVMRIGAFQFFNQTSRTFSRASASPGGAATTQGAEPQVPYGPNPGVSEAGLDFILSQEGFRSSVYADAAGYATIGFGHRVSATERFDAPMSVAEGLRLFSNDIATRVDPFLGTNTIEAALSQRQVDALGSLIFNVGGGAFSNSKLLRLVNAGNFEAAGHQFGRWIYAGGRIIPGLATRREEEAAMFLGR